jgi:hypothetical protein
MGLKKLFQYTATLNIPPNTEVNKEWWYIRVQLYLTKEFVVKT